MAENLTPAQPFLNEKTWGHIHDMCNFNSFKEFIEQHEGMDRENFQSAYEHSDEEMELLESCFDHKYQAYRTWGHETEIHKALLCSRYTSIFIHPISAEDVLIIVY